MAIALDFFGGDTFDSGLAKGKTFESLSDILFWPTERSSAVFLEGISDEALGICRPPPEVMLPFALFVNS
jgi:hypothetical protein